MGTEYHLGTHGEKITPQGKGISLMAYEMSGELDVYADVPNEQVDMDAWEGCARVDLWKDVSPTDLFKIGLNILKVAELNLTEEESKFLKTEVLKFVQQ